MDFILTGERGDLGKQCVQCLEQHSLSWLPFSQWSASKECNRGAKTLLHLAARHPVNSIQAVLNSNVNYWLRVLELAKEQCEHLIFCSSTSVYGSKRTGVITELNPGLPDDAYGMTKWLGEKLLQDSGKAGLSLRCPAVLELQNSHNFMSGLFDKLFHNQPVTLFNTDKPFNTFIAPKQFMEFVIQVSEQPLTIYEPVNLAANDDLNLAAITEIVRSELGSNSEIRINPDAGPGHTVNIDRAKHEYGFDPGNSEEQIKGWANLRKKIKKEQFANDR